MNRGIGADRAAVRWLAAMPSDAEGNAPNAVTGGKEISGGLGGLVS